MKILVQRHAILLAALLQMLPLVRNFLLSPTSASAFAFVFRWGLGATAAIGTVDAVSGASNRYTSASTFIGTVGVPFTNNLTLQSTKGDGGSFAVITSNSVSAVLSKNGQNTNFAMPPGLVLQFLDNVNLTSPVYDAIHGIPTTPGTNTFIISMEYESSIVSTNITIEILPGTGVLPGITNQPIGLTNLVGSNITFNVTAGPPPLSYQWFFNTNTPLQNAAGPNLTLTNVQLSQAGYYSVVVSNSLGAITSSPAMLAVWELPAIINQPLGLTNVAGSSVDLQATATGVPSPSYQWFFDDNLPVTDATNSTLSLTNVLASQGGSYFVIITNSAGSVTSSTASLVITLPPAPTITATLPGGLTNGIFQFTFNPVIGLTNTIKESSALTGGLWETLTNIAPPASTDAITISDPFTASNRFYRVQIIP